ncbi:MAG: helix-turn-helix transcriptional regulator [Polyangiaceae bacterium]|nr:helix-turn-helix transcriptional regulator [Polyangiaceae bacterium]
MPKRTPPVFPAAARQLAALGERLAAARKRRRMTQGTLAARAGISIPTLRKLEQGEAGISISAVVRILQVLGLAADLDRLAADDELGRRLQDIHQKGPPRGRRRSTPP